MTRAVDVEMVAVLSASWCLARRQQRSGGTTAGLAAVVEQDKITDKVQYHPRG